MKRWWTIWVLLLMAALKLNAQIYVVGQDPASLQWRQMQSKNFKIIYPENSQQVAVQYLKTLETTQKTTLQPFLQGAVPPFSIVLHNQSTLANAMVSPAPLHADFFTIPDQLIYPQRWSYQLSLHEYRHFVQFRKMYQGVGKGLYYVFGQAGPAALLGAFVPLWFVEGDAVFNETIHSRSGRGRYPSFWMDLQAQVLEKGIYRYDKAVLGSYKDYVPDHYTLGYQLILFGAGEYGYEMWNSALDNVARRPYTFKPFVQGLKKYSGLNKRKFYRFAMGTLKYTWKQEVKQRKVTPFEPVENEHNKYFTHYRFPYQTSNGDVIVEKSSIDDIRRFVMLLQDGSEKVLFTPGFDYAESLSANDSLLCWNEKKFDIRWSNKDFSVIKVYNFQTKELRVLTKDSRYFAPSLSPDATKIVAASVSEEGVNALVILDAQNGHVLKKITTPENLYFTTPSWSESGREIVVTVLGDKGKSLCLYDVVTDRCRLLLPYGFTEINRPYKAGRRVFFTGTWKGKNDIYELNLSNGKLYRVLSARYGAADGRLTRQGKLLFSNYTADGYRIARAADFEENKEMVDVFRLFHYPVDDMITPETFILEDTSVKTPSYQDTTYNKWKHLFNIHSWGPMIVDVNNYSFVPNAVVMSQNLLGTAVSTLGYYYDVNERKGKVKFTFDYTGLFPVLGLSVQYRGRRKYLTDEQGERHEVNWTETDLAFNTYVPLRFINSKWIRGVRPSFSLGQKFLKMSKDQNVSFKEEKYTIFYYGVYGYNALKRSRLDLLSPWSQSLAFYYRHTPFSELPSSVSLLSATFTFPGVLRHHGFRFYVGNEWKTEGNYPFSDLVRLPRGYSDMSFTRMTTLRMDYALPIAYPDWDVPTVFYLKRIYAIGFYDHARYRKEKTKAWEHISSAGVELYTNWHFLSLPVEFTLGVRGSYLFTGKFEPELLFSIGY